MDDASDYSIEMPEMLIGGVYANGLAVWHSPHEFTLDFCVSGDSESGAEYVGVARVRIPLTMIFEVIRRLNEGMTDYEQRYGEILPPQLSSESE